MTESKFTKYRNTIHNHFENVRNATYSTYRTVENYRMSFDDYLKLRQKRVYDHPSYKRLNGVYEAHISGICEALYHALEGKMIWKHSYKTRSGNTKFATKWEKMPHYIRVSGNYKCGFYWKGTTKPWGRVVNGNPAPGLSKPKRKKKLKKITL